MPKKLTTNEFIEKAKQIHGDKYDYSKSIYTDRATPIVIIHNDHEFLQKYRDHLSGCGCGSCYKDNRKFNLEQIKNKLLELDLQYCSGTNTTLVVKDSDGVKYTTSAKRLFNGIKPSVITAVNKNHWFSVAASKIHNNFYDYSLVNYNKTSDTLQIVCPWHGIFLQKASDHMARKGCKDCAKLCYGYTKTIFKDQCDKNNNGIGILYIIRCFSESEEFYKIGRTSLSVKIRYAGFTRMPYQYEITNIIYAEPDVVFNLEYCLHRLGKQLDLHYTPLIPFKGKGECFKVSKDHPLANM